MGNWLELEPARIAAIDLQQFGRPDFSTDDGVTKTIIMRDLQRVATQIIEQKTAIVFPKAWSDGARSEVPRLVDRMASEIVAHFRSASLESELPWTFMALQHSPTGGGPFSDFIRAVHRKMLANDEVYRVKMDELVRKGGPILFSGPTGTGKSYAAKLLATDPKFGSRLVEVNLAAISADLLESRMRGFEPGTFTGSGKVARKGWFEEAHGGVLFLDEFQAVPPEAQVQLLDALNAVSDVVEIARVGADHERTCFVAKVVLAINDDLTDLLESGRIRRDLYFRIRSIQHFPSLKDRLAKQDDKALGYLRGLLESYRWKSFPAIEQASGDGGSLIQAESSFFPVWDRNVLMTLAQQNWQGNFRELERVAFDLFDMFGRDAESLAGSKQAGLITIEHVEEAIRPWRSTASQNLDQSDIGRLPEVERERLDNIQAAIRKSKFVVAQILKNQRYFLSRASLRSFLQSHIEWLDADIKSDSRMVKFLKL